MNLPANVECTNMPAANENVTFYAGRDGGINEYIMFDVTADNGIPAKYLPWFPYTDINAGTSSAFSYDVVIEIFVKLSNGSWDSRFMCRGTRLSVMSPGMAMLDCTAIQPSNILVSPLPPDEIVCGVKYSISGADAYGEAESLDCIASTNYLRGL